MHGVTTLTYLIQSSDIETATVSRHIESSITRLLVATRQLLEGLTRWSTGTMREEDVSVLSTRVIDNGADESR